MEDISFKIEHPELFTPASIKRKAEIIMELLISSKKLQEHTISCVLIEENSGDCEICDNVSAFANVVLLREMKSEGGKADIKKIIEDKIFDREVFG